MVHRLHNRNTGYTDNIASTLATSQTAISATEGATALNLDNVIQENVVVKEKKEIRIQWQDRSEKDRSEKDRSESMRMTPLLG